MMDMNLHELRLIWGRTGPRNADIPVGKAGIETRISTGLPLTPSDGERARVSGRLSVMP
jgi:hypothetical protein